MGSRLVPLVVVVSLASVACGADDDGAAVDGAAVPPGRDSGEVVSELERVVPPPDAPVFDVVHRIDEFAFELQRLVASESENLVFSPASIATAFAMAHAGASEQTQATLEAAFGFPAEPDIHEAMNALLRALAAAESDDLTLAIANSGWAQSGRDIGQPYLDTLATQYGAGLHTLDLQDDSEGSRATINDWVAEQTRDRIPELLPEGFVNAQSVYVLVNTVYLKAKWQQVFGKYPTEPGAFSRSDGSTTDVDMMHNAELQGRYLVKDGLAVAELPYRGGQLAMRVLVPDDLTALEQRLDAAEWDRIESALRSGIVDLSLPKWDFGTSIDLADPLGDLGVEIPGGDYSGIAPGLFLGQAVHGANISVDEQGTEAAAATGLGFEESGPPPPDAIVRADRPFLYAIVHQPTGLILFTGHVADPSD
jgi:serine protease inhibitor